MIWAKPSCPIPGRPPFSHHLSFTFTRLLNHVGNLPSSHPSSLFSEPSVPSQGGLNSLLAKKDLKFPATFLSTFIGPGAPEPYRAAGLELYIPRMFIRGLPYQNHWGSPPSSNYYKKNIQGLNSSITRHGVTEWICKQNQQFSCIQETHFNNKLRCNYYNTMYN